MIYYSMVPGILGAASLGQDTQTTDIRKLHHKICCVVHMLEHYQRSVLWLMHQLVKYSTTMHARSCFYWSS